MSDMPEKNFVMDENHVHLVNPAGDGYTLCGLGVDSDWHDLRDTDTDIVTCPDCIRLLKTLRMVRFCEHYIVKRTRDREDRLVETCQGCGMYRVRMDLGFTDWRRGERE